MARPTRSIGNENVENEVVDLNGSEVMERPEDSIETQIVEVERGGAEDLVEAIDGDQLEGDVDQLVRHAENVEASLEEGGLDPIAARATDIAVEDICGRWNIKRKTVGTENFQSGQGRMSATRLGLESIIDSAREGIRQLIEWVKRRIAAIKDVWRKYVNVGKAIKGRVEKMRKRVAKLGGSPDKSEKVDTKKIWQLAYGDTVDLQKLRNTSSNDIENLANALGEAIDASLNESDRAFESALEDDGKASVTGAGKATSAKIVWELGGSSSKFARQFPAGVKNGKIYGTFGGIVLEYKLPDTEITCVKYVACKPEDLKDEERDPLGTDEMENILDAVFIAGSQLEDYIKKFSKVERSMDKLKRTLDKASTRASKEAGKKDVTTAKLSEGRNSVKAAKASFENAQELDKLYRGTLTSYATGSLAYIQASFAAYNDED